MLINQTIAPCNIKICLSAITNGYLLLNDKAL